MNSLMRPEELSRIECLSTAIKSTGPLTGSVFALSLYVVRFKEMIVEFCIPDEPLSALETFIRIVPHVF